MKKKTNKHCIKFFYIFFGLLYLLPIKTEAQENELKVSNASFAEKIYLQLDRKVYTNGDTVWFKCIIANAAEHIPSLLSGVLYVELIGTDEKIIEKKIVKIENGIGQGNFDLDKKIPKGNYLIRAYTQWNRNFENDFIFEEYIQVFRNEDKNSEPISNIKLIKEGTDNNHLEVFFNPQIIDSLQKNRLNVYITIDDKKDSILLKKEKNKYRLEYDIAEKSQFATFKIQTENNKTFAKTFVLKKDYIDLQFFPESGELVHGLSSKVGFKALDANGKGKMIEGEIIDDKENVITSFKSNVLGMGIFFITNTDNSKNYYARLKSQSLKYPLPKAATSGNILSVDKLSDKILIKVISNYLQNDSIFLRVSFRGIESYEKKVKLNQGLYTSLISTNFIPEGIVSFTLLDNSKNPIAERLYFNEKSQSRIQINLSTDKNTYDKRELTNLNIQTTNNKDEPIKANTSVLVIRKEELGAMQNLRQNILSYLLIDSELKGNIENPGYYFNNNTNSHYDTEALMLTQGWSKYNYSKPYQSLSVAPEKSLTVSGKVNKLFSEKKGAKDIQLTMMTSGMNKSFYTQMTDSLGNFNFSLNDEYGKQIDVLIQTAKKTNKKVNNSVVLDKKNSPSITFEHNKSIEQVDSIVEKFIEKSNQQKEIQENFDAQFGSILLNQVNITNNSNSAQKKVNEKYGKPKTIIRGKDILSKEKKWSYGLYSVLLFNYPDKVTIRRNSEQFLEAFVNNEPTLVLVDGIVIPYYSYTHIADISPSEVKSFEIIENVTGFRRLFCEVHTEIFSDCDYIAPASGNIIAIYTHAGIGLSGASKPGGLNRTTIPVFASPKEFYAPRYKNIQPDSWQHPDIRTLIHWQPIVQTDDTGKASTSFYNADNKGEIMIVVEAISDNGEIGYQVLNYGIKD